MKLIPQKYHNLLRVIVGLALFVWLLSLVDLKEVMALFWQGDLTFLGIGSLLLILAYCGLHGLRFHYCINKISPNPATSYRLFFLGYLFNNLFPGSAGGDAIRLYYLRNMSTTGWGKPAGLLLIFRLAGFVTLWGAGAVYIIANYSLIIDIFGKHIQFDLTAGMQTVLIGLIVFLAAVLIYYSQSIKEHIVKFLTDVFKTFGLFNLKTYIVILALSMGFHFVRMAGFYFLVLFFGGHLEYIHFLFVLFVTGIAISIPVSFGALGLMEGAIGGTLVLFGVSVAAATGVALAHRLVLLIIAAVGGIVYMIGIPEQHFKNDKQEI